MCAAPSGTRRCGGWWWYRGGSPTSSRISGELALSNSGLAAALAVALLLGGCGFQPLYGERQGSQPLTAALNGVSVDPPKNRIAQLIRNEFLIDVPPGQGGLSVY